MEKDGGAGIRLRSAGNGQHVCTVFQVQQCMTWKEEGKQLRREVEIIYIRQLFSSGILGRERSEL